MQNKLERLIKAVYRKYKSSLSVSAEHPDEETMACFLEGRLPMQEAEFIKRHLISCETCAQGFVAQAELKVTDELEVPEDLISRVKSLPTQDNSKESILEIFLRLKESCFELLNSNGDVLVGQELVPAPVLRSRKIKAFKDEVTVLKDFNGTRVEVKIENKDSAAFALIVLAKEKQTSLPIKDLRVTLLKEGVELESYITDSGRVAFEHVLLGKYRIEISDIKNKFASIILDVKT